MQASRLDFTQIIERCVSILIVEQKRGTIRGGSVNGSLVQIIDYDSIVIVSDLHGDSKTFFRILEEINYKIFFGNPRNKMIFLGDYVDRGTDSIGVLYTICHLKLTYPDSVILMRGNHEASKEFPFEPLQLPYDIENRFGSPSAGAIYEKVLSLFHLLTLVTIIQGRLLLVHAGLPIDSINAWKESLANLEQIPLRRKLMEEILWSDPTEFSSEKEWEPSNRGYGKLFAKSITERLLLATGTKAVIRGHEPCDGCAFSHDKKILTLFSSIEAYPGFGAAYLLIPKGQLDTITDGKELVRFVKFVKFRQSKT